MARFTIRTINSTFFTEVELADVPGANDALTEGIRGGLMIAADEIYAGGHAAVVEVIVEDGAGKPVRRVAVSVSTAPLAIGDGEKRPAPMAFNDH